MGRTELTQEAGTGCPQRVQGRRTERWSGLGRGCLRPSSSRGGRGNHLTPPGTAVSSPEGAGVCGIHPNSTTSCRRALPHQSSRYQASLKLLQTHERSQVGPSPTRSTHTHRHTYTRAYTHTHVHMCPHTHTRAQLCACP